MYAYVVCTRSHGLPAHDRPRAACCAGVYFWDEETQVLNLVGDNVKVKSLRQKVQICGLDAQVMMKAILANGGSEAAGRYKFSVWMNDAKDLCLKFIKDAPLVSMYPA